MPTILPLSAVPGEMVEQVLDEAFGPQRHARTAYRIRDGVEWLAALSFAALDDDEYLAATIQIWPVALFDPDGRPHPMLMVGPVAVLPQLQGQGYGKALVTASLAEMNKGALPQVLIGDASYYGAWGFTAEHTREWHCPGPYDQDRLLVRYDNPAVLPPKGMLGPWRPADMPPPTAR